MDIEEARAKSRAVWDRMAPSWHKHRERLWDTTREVGLWLIEQVDPQPGHTILEIAAGPGDTGFAAARSIGEEGRLISTDFAEEMVAVARVRADELGIANVEVRTMDAENMDLPDDSVDRVICRWGLMLMLDPARALEETRRVLRDDGQLAFSVWGGPAENPWVTLMGMVLTQRGHAPQNDPFGPGGMFSLADHERLRSLVTGAGFQQVTIQEMEVAWRFRDFDDFWAFQSEMSGAISAVLEELDAEEAAELRAEVENATSAFRSGAGYEFPGLTLNVHAR
jgi:SAM-dependent methyltransferase